MCAAARVDAIALPTASRPRSLQRSLRSITDHLTRYGRTTELFVCDASDGDTTWRCNAEVVATATKDYAGAIRLVGVTERLGFAAALSARSGVERSLVEFGLIGPQATDERFGANRNCILLMQPQRLLICSDDDVLWRPAWPGHLTSTTDYRVMGDEVERELWSCATRREAIAQIVPADECLMDHHEAVLGKNLGDVMSQLRDRGRTLAAFRPCSHMRASLGLGTGSIVTSHSGTYGDSGLHSPFRTVCSSSVQSVLHLLSSEATCRQACTSREIVSSAPALTLSHGGPWMAMACGLDNRDIIPPYCPIGRNEDGVLGAVIRTCFPDAYFAHLPLSVLHSPPEARVYADTWLDELVRPRLCDAVVSSVGTFDETPSQDRRRQLTRLGAHLEELARMRAPDLHSFLGDRWTHGVTARLDDIERRLVEQHDAPAFWRKIAEDCARTCARYLADGDAAGDMARCGGRLGPIAPLLRLYGELLRAWPALVATAAAMACREEAHAR
jgi:hypothetical protein